MRLSHKAAKVIFATTAVVLLCIAYLFYNQIKGLLYAQEQKNESNLVKLKLEQTLSALKDAETAQRGFLLTKDSLFLQPYNGAYGRSKILLKELRIHSSDHASQLKDLDRLQTLVEVRFRTFNHVIDHYNNPDISEETKKLHLMRGKSDMDSIRLYVQQLSNWEDGLWLERERAKERYNFLTPFFGVLLMMVAIGIMVFSYGKIIEQLNRSQRLLGTLRTVNRKLKNKNHQLEAYNKELDSFTYIASHDLKEPLRKIMTYATMIESSGDNQLSETGRAHFDKIKHSALRMRNLLNDLLEYSHINMSERRFEAVDLNKVVRDVMGCLEEEIKETQTEIKTDNLPIVKGMPFQIKQLFENLIANSIKYRSQNGVPTISIESTEVSCKEIKEHFPKSHDRYYMLQVKDNGLGFDQLHAEKIFQLFKRLHPKTGQPGTGIGLTICKRIIENHEGYIKAKSEVNKGTSFEIYLPAG